MYSTVVVNVQKNFEDFSDYRWNIVPAPPLRRQTPEAKLKIKTTQFLQIMRSPIMNINTPTKVFLERSQLRVVTHVTMSERNQEKTAARRPLSSLFKD